MRNEKIIFIQNILIIIKILIKFYINVKFIKFDLFLL